MVDIFVTEESDTVGISIEFAETVMTEADAMGIITRWSNLAASFMSCDSTVSQKHIVEKVSGNKPCNIF